MLQAIVHFSLRLRGIVMVLACLLLGYGLYVAMHAKLDVSPMILPPAPGSTPAGWELEFVAVGDAAGGVAFGGAGGCSA